MLRVEGVDAYYGLSHVLQGVSLTVEAGEAVALLGRNTAVGTFFAQAVASGCERLVLLSGRGEAEAEQAEEEDSRNRLAQDPRR